MSILNENATAATTGTTTITPTRGQDDDEQPLTGGPFRAVIDRRRAPASQSTHTHRHTHTHTHTQTNIHLHTPDRRPGGGWWRGQRGRGGTGPAARYPPRKRHPSIALVAVTTLAILCVWGAVCFSLTSTPTTASCALLIRNCRLGHHHTNAGARDLVAAGRPLHWQGYGHSSEMYSGVMRCDIRAHRLIKAPHRHSSHLIRRVTRLHVILL